ncbi:uncharacterized protein [Onthophagus taurus]|uniref:uncharacterized protein n=1 Tax=Onthophagus taurus TaxID=166361 RepID=UPI0039BEB286
MLVNILRFLLLSVYILGTYSESSKSCLEYPLGPPLNFKASPDATQVVTLSWEPPEYYESCDVQYLIHLRNANSSEYLTDIQKTNNLVFKFPYEKFLCYPFNATIYATYEGLTSTPASAIIIPLDPLTELGAPVQLLLENSQETLKLEWLPPAGYEQCAALHYFNFGIEFYDIDRNITFSSLNYIKQLESTHVYGPYDFEYYCDVVAIKVFGYFLGRKSHTIAKTVTYGPKGYCTKNHSN